MAKYVCDFEQVKQSGKDICEAADILGNDVSKYATQVSTDLSSWNGSAKAMFLSKAKAQVDTAIENVEEAKALGTFIQEAADKIEALENELAGLSI